MFHMWCDGKKVKFPATWNTCARVASRLSLQAAGSPFIPKYLSDSSGDYVGKITQPVAVQYQYPQMVPQMVPSTAPQTALPATQTPGPPVAERRGVRQAHESSVAHLGPGSGGNPSVSASCVSCLFRTPGRFRECPGPEAWTPAQEHREPSLESPACPSSPPVPSKSPFVSSSEHGWPFGQPGHREGRAWRPGPLLFHPGSLLWDPLCLMVPWPLLHEAAGSPPALL